MSGTSIDSTKAQALSPMSLALIGAGGAAKALKPSAHPNSIIHKTNEDISIREKASCFLEGFEKSSKQTFNAVIHPVNTFTSIFGK